jgi:hypothetical protein
MEARTTTYEKSQKHKQFCAAATHCCRRQKAHPGNDLRHDFGDLQALPSKYGRPANSGDFERRADVRGQLRAYRDTRKYLAQPAAWKQKTPAGAGVVVDPGRVLRH